MGKPASFDLSCHSRPSPPGFPPFFLSVIPAFLPLRHSRPLPRHSREGGNLDGERRWMSWERRRLARKGAVSPESGFVRLVSDWQTLNPYSDWRDLRLWRKAQAGQNKILKILILTKTRRPPLSPAHSREGGNPDGFSQARHTKSSTNGSQRIPSPFTGEG